MNENPKLGEFCWNELATTDVQAAKDFYGKVFGWKFTDHTDMCDMSYTMVKINDREIAGIWAIPKEQQKDIPPHWMTYILVEDVEKSLEKCRQEGASIIKEATDIGDFGRLGIIADPTGAHIALWESINQ